jgi:hypothetical protein
MQRQNIRAKECKGVYAARLNANIPFRAGVPKSRGGAAVAIISSDNLSVLKGHVGDAGVFLILFHSYYPAWTLHLSTKALQLLPKYKPRHISRDVERVRVSRMCLEGRI